MGKLHWLAMIATGVAVTAQTAGRWEMVSYTAPAGFQSVQKPDGGGRIEFTKASRDNYCLMAMYASTPAGQSLEESFAAEWEAVAVKSIRRVAAPVPAVKATGNTRAAIGRAESTSGGQPVSAMLIVLDAGARVVSLLVLTPTLSAYDAYAAEVEGMLRTMTVERRGEGSPAPTSAGGRLVIPPVGRSLTIADLAGDWGHNDGITTSYVDRATGAYAGTDSIHFTNRWTISKDGGIALDFFGIRNGKKIVEKSSGTVVLTGGVLAITMSNRQRYVLRGWLELPDMTIMKLNGPWYDAPIPASILSNPEQGTNLDQTWVRKK